jgi:protocatechuate 3,4-dioxygenase, beta subunit
MSGRILSIGPTDNTSFERTPRAPLLTIPQDTRRSFVPWIERPLREPVGFLDLTRLAAGRPRADGEAIEVSGKVTDERGRAVRGAILEVWNANHYGRYAHRDDHTDYKLDPNFIGIGRLRTDQEGRYRFWTIFPGHYIARPDIGRWRPRHLHFSLLGGGARLVTQMYFKDDPYNDRDPMRILMGDLWEARQVARDYAAEDAEVVRGYRFDIAVAGRESVFFEPNR